MAQKWTREEAINFECARETITQVIAIVAFHIAKEIAKAGPDLRYIAELDRMQSDLGTERESLSIFDHADIARIFEVYGKLGVAATFAAQSN